MTTPAGPPPEAIEAATKALLAYWGNPPWGDDEVREPVKRILEAAAPHLAAAERERCAQICERVDATYWSGDGITPPLPFADLLREQP